MNINYNEIGNVVLVDNQELCEFMEKTFNITVLPQLLPVGLTIDGDTFECRKHLLATVSTNTISDMEQLHDIDGKKELMLAGLCGMMSAGVFTHMYGREIVFTEESDDSGNVFTKIILRAALR